MDHVLLEPRGYQRALVETVLRIGRSLGYQDVNLMPQDIAHYEAAGSTSEWDTAAICVALLLKHAWKRYPDVRLSPALDAQLVPPHDLPPPDMGAFARALAQSGLAGAPPRVRAEQLMTANGENLSSDQLRSLQTTLREARRFEFSLTFRIFQELVLGSKAYSQAYQTPSNLHVDGSLERFDRPTLKPERYEQLIAWLARPNHEAAICTNRPSMSPDGKSGTPEAETGADLVRLNQIPLVGLGALAWRSALDGLAPEAYLKPSPVHALTGMLMALGEPIGSALETAVALTRGEIRNGWERLTEAHVLVFEDAANELRSSLGARQALASQGIKFELSLCGVARSTPKKVALQAAGARVYPDLNAALAELPD